MAVAVLFPFKAGRLPPHSEALALHPTHRKARVKMVSVFKSRLFNALALFLAMPAAFAGNSATTPVPGKSENWTARNDAMNARAREGNVDLIYIGDSIVQNWDDEGKEVWEHYYAPRNALSLGISGDRTEHVLWRLAHGNIDGIAPKLAIVMIGQNNGTHNTGDEIGAGVAAIVQLLRERLPETKILLLAIFQRREHPTEERAVLDRANEIASKLADNKKIFYMDINHLFLRPDGTIPADLMPDFEHPNAEGHRIWAEAIEPKVAELMGDAPVAPMPSLAVKPKER